MRLNLKSFILMKTSKHRVRLFYILYFILYISFHFILFISYPMLYILLYFFTSHIFKVTIKNQHGNWRKVAK